MNIQIKFRSFEEVKQALQVQEKEVPILQRTVVNLEGIKRAGFEQEIQQFQPTCLLVKGYSASGDDRDESNEINVYLKILHHAHLRNCITILCIERVYSSCKILLNLRNNLPQLQCLIIKYIQLDFETCEIMKALNLEELIVDNSSFDWGDKLTKSMQIKSTKTAKEMVQDLANDIEESASIRKVSKAVVFLMMYKERLVNGSEKELKI